MHFENPVRFSSLFLGFESATQMTQVPAATASGSSTFARGKLAKSLPLKVSKYFSPWAAMNAACRASWVRLPLMSWLCPKSSQCEKTSWRSIKKGYELRSCSISCSALRVPQPSSWASLGRVTTAQYSINTCGLVHTRCARRASIFREFTAAKCCFALGSAARSQRFVPASTLAISRKCCRDSRPNQTSQIRQCDFEPTHQSWRLIIRRESWSSNAQESPCKGPLQLLLSQSPQILPTWTFRQENSMGDIAADELHLRRSHGLPSLPS